MKLFDERYQEDIICPLCKGLEFTEFDKRTRTSSYHIFCQNEKCKNDLLIPMNLVIKKVIIIK